MSDRVTTNHCSYHGPLGEVSRAGHYFLAWKEETIFIGTYQTLDAAIEALMKEADISKSINTE
jgi:hypothetical protein